MAAHDTGKRTTVLLVESEPAVRLSVAASLARAGFAVIEAESLDEAWSTLEARLDVGVLLADLDQGPGGLDLAWKAHDRWPSLGLVITSGHVRHLRPADVPGNGCFLPRPLPVEVLLQEIGEAARHSIH
ncbi:response regulator [Microvirga sp. BT688]|uniref:response regulator n=1 Tax=Microvirga sp. TaxID=1873136 RepID=UPI001685B55E|nr:response regulator [Microvirga sp.]MBD2749930.1 response regulator [Microvirga sp.]